jgi:SPX domain protein involved in polyphosphate accumulation
METAAAMNPETIFERHELKYLLTARQRQTLEQAMSGYMKPDPYGESTVCNIYYDTPDFRLIRRSLEKPIYKEKLRVRSYGPVTAEQPVFLELKKKYKSIVYKRRILVPEQAATDFLQKKTPLPEDTQIGRELSYFQWFYRELGPAVYLSYDREGLFGADDPSLRITFDTDIRWRTEDMSLTSRPGGEPILSPEQCLMEIKAGSAMPLWLTDLLTRNSIRQISFSKYGTAFQSMLQNDLKNRGVFCA